MSRLRLLVLSNGGVGHTERWVDYFADRGDDVHLASIESGVPTRAVEHRLPSLLPVPMLRYPAALPWVARLAKRVDPDVVVGHFVPNYGFLCALLGRRPFVCVAWGSDVLLNPARSRFHRWRARYTLERADVVLSDADMLTRAIEAQGIRPRRIETYTFGVDTARFRPGEGPKTDPPVILSYRQLLPLYHVDLLVRAVPLLRQRTDRPFRVRIIGEGTERPALIRLAEELGVSDVVHFVEGRLDDDTLIREIQNASIYVSTSRSDTTSVSLLEAFACGVAPVVTDIPGNREWIEEGVSGYLIPLERPEYLADRLEDLLAHPERRDAFVARNVRAVRSRADWARNMNRTRAMLDDLVRSTGRMRKDS